MRDSGNRHYGLKVIFMRRQAGMGGREYELGCDGKRVIGIFARAGVQVDALGLVQE